MMRFRPLSKMRSYLLPAVAAIFLAVGPIACSSSGDESPNPALEGATAGEEAASGNNAGSNANGEAAENGNAAAANANTENANTAKPEGEAAASNNPIGNELNNAIANEQGGATTAAPAEDGGGAINAEVNGNAAAEPPPMEASNPAAAADANAGNPFASPANSEAVPSNAAPYDPGTAAAAPTEAAPVPVDASVASQPAVAPAGDSASAAAPTGPTALPEMGSKMAYYVMRGDTLGAIAQKIYGSRKKWKALQAENGLADANKIYPGDVIYFTLDDSSKAFAEKYEIGNRQAYTVSKGDTLSRLAAKFYGTQGAWRALWKENPQVLNPDRIRVGMVLTYRATSKVAIKDENEAELETQGKDSDENADNETGTSDESVVSVEGEFSQLTASAE
jgi:nucleoid-associated protein YgaU